MEGANRSLLQDEVEGEAKRDDKTWQAAAPAKLVLVKDALAGNDHSYGSFLVFRKHDQNVRGFRRAMRDLGSAVGCFSRTCRRHGGRSLRRRHADCNGRGNRALVRSTILISPATSTVLSARSSRMCARRIRAEKLSVRSRRSTKLSRMKAASHCSAWYPIWWRADRRSSRKVNCLKAVLGLLFFCYQSDILEQFEFIQRVWANNPFFLEPAKSGKKNQHYDVTGLDPLIGQKHPTSPGAAQPARNWPSAWGQPTKKCPIDFAGFVSMKGGEYFLLAFFDFPAFAG